MRFKVDENLPSEIAASLRAAGHDAETVPEEGLSGAADGELMDCCLAEGRTMVTLDLDFANIKAYPPGDYPGIVVLRLSRQDKPSIMELWERALSLLRTEELDGRLWILEGERLRIRD